ncbi:MAG: peptidylprolyl isomerase [Actinomycetota bacterium]|nr:peptidylprolyl isomerase [Actinomycetota bacterium]
MGRAQKLKQQRKEEEKKRQEEERKKVYRNIFVVVVCIVAIGATVALVLLANILKKEKVTVREMVLETSKGEIVIEMLGDDAPMTVDHIAGLVEEGFYDDILWYRIEDFVVQTGSHVQSLLAQQGEEELDQDLLNQALTEDQEVGVVLDEISASNVRGAVGMAKPSDEETGEPTPNSATSEFYILKQDVLGLDTYFTVFGNVVRGMEVVDSLEDTDLLIKAEIREVERDKE